MRKIATDLDTDVEQQPTQLEPARVVTTEFTYESQASTTAGTGTAAELNWVLSDVVGGTAGVYVDESDYIVGTDGFDIIYGGAGNDLIDGRGGDDFLHGDDGNDTVLGGAGNDWLNGWDGDDTLDGGEGNDRLEGGYGNDIMRGGEGHDTLVAGSGTDIMVGGLGRDVFVVHGGHSSPAAVDLIADFEVGTHGGYGSRDFVDLREALKSSTFTGTSVEQAFQQGYIYLVQHGTPGEDGYGTTVFMDRNGSAPDYGYTGDVALADLLNVAMDQLHTGSYASNFIV